MEDPKRMRTKLRLDLADVRKQIEDLEDLLRKDKSSENVEAHRKLVEYEKKLKNQYERMTGLSIEQATKLEEREREKVPEGSATSAILGIFGGLLAAWGFYNTLLHSIEGFTPFDVVDWFMGLNKSVPSLVYFMSSLTWPSSMYLVTAPIAGGAFLMLLSANLDHKKGNLAALLEGIGYLVATGYLAYIVFISPDGTAGATNFQNNLFYFTIAIIASGILVFLASFSNPGIFRKLLGFSSGILFVYSGVQLYLLTTTPSEVDPELVWQWPWIIMPVIIANVLFAFQSLFKFR